MESDAGELLKIFACSITEWSKEWEDARGDDEEDDGNKGGVEAEDKKTMNKSKVKQATAETLATIIDN